MSNFAGNELGGGGISGVELGSSGIQGPELGLTPPRRLRLGQGTAGGRAGLSLDQGPDPLSPRVKSYIRSKLQSPNAAKDILGLATRGAPTTTSYVERRRQLIQEFEQKNLPPEAIDAVRDFIDNRGRYAPPKHSSGLSELMRGLGAIESTGAGFAKGYHQWFTNRGKSEWGWVAPWEAYHAAGAGFHNIGKSVSQQYTYEQYLKETTKPGSLVSRFAMPIGLGMSMLFDPTMYLTFGSTSVAKTAAYQGLRRSYELSYKSAEDAIRKGTTTLKSGNLATKSIDTIHGRIPLDYDHIDEIASHFRVQAGMPHDLPDALDQLRARGLQTKASIRATGGYYDPKLGEFVDATMRQKIAARTLRHNVQGGRGVRFAGMQIPGTPQLGAAISQGMRALGERSDLAHAVGGGLIPQHYARHIASDGLRGAALTDFAQFATERNALQTHLTRSIRDLERVEVHNPDDLAALNASGSPLVVHTRPEQRIDLLTRDESKLNPVQRTLKNNIEAEKSLYTEQAIAAGAKDTELSRLWKQLTDYYHDPIPAIAEYKWKTSTKVFTNKFVEKMLGDRLYSLPMAGEKAIAQGVADPTLLHHVPAGYEDFSYGGRRYAVRSEVKSALEKVVNPVYMDHESRRFLNLINKPQNFWKIYSTSPNPAFHVMNFIGAVWNNLLAGVYNPNDYLRAAATLYQGRKEEAAQLGQKFGITRQVPESTAKGRAAHQVLTEAENRAGLGRTGFLFGEAFHGQMSPQQMADVTQGPLGKIDPRAAEAAYENLAKDRGTLSKIVAPPPGATKKQVARFYGVTTPRRAAGVALAAHANPLALVMFAPELARRGRTLGSTIEDLVRLAPFQKYANDPVVRQYIHLFGPISVGGVRHPGFTKEDQRIMYDIGASISRHFQFDYTDLSNFERHVAKSIFPFWTYYKKNFVLQAKELARQPRKFDVALRMMNFANDNGQQLGPYESILPQYFQNLQAFQIPVPGSVRGMLGLPKDQPLFLNPKMPFVSINLFPPLWNIINDPHETTSQKLLETIAPVAGSVGPFAGGVPFPKILLEAGTGHNLGLNRPIDFQRASSNDLRQSYVPASMTAQLLSKVPGLNHWFHVVHTKKGPRINATSAYILDQMETPFINNLGQAVPVAGDTETDRAKKRSNLVSWLTGVRLMPADVLRLTRNDAFTIKNLLEAKQSELRQQNQDLNDEEYFLLQTVKDDLSVINDAYNQREGYNG